MSSELTAAVTGAASGIGLAAATALAQSGSAVVLGDRDAGKLRESRELIETRVEDARIETLAVDVSDPDAVESFVQSAIDFKGQLDVLVTCAGIYDGCDFNDLSASAWDPTLNVNLRGTALCAAAAARHMRSLGGGSIVMTSSISSVISEPGSAAYSASKAAINSLARTMAVDLSGFGIAANAVAPGWVVTGMTEDDISSASEQAFDQVNAIHRPAQPEEIAEVIRWLALEAPRFLTGSTLFVDGGQTALASVPA